MQRLQAHHTAKREALEKSRRNKGQKPVKGKGPSDANTDQANQPASAQKQKGPGISPKGSGQGKPPPKELRTQDLPSRKRKQSWGSGGGGDLGEAHGGPAFRGRGGNRGQGAGMRGQGPYRGQGPVRGRGRGMGRGGMGYGGQGGGLPLRAMEGGPRGLAHMVSQVGSGGATVQDLMTFMQQNQMNAQQQQQQLMQLQEQAMAMQGSYRGGGMDDIQPLMGGGRCIVFMAISSSSYLRAKD